MTSSGNMPHAGIKISMAGLAAPTPTVMARGQEVRGAELDTEFPRPPSEGVPRCPRSLVQIKATVAPRPGESEADARARVVSELQRAWAGAGARVSALMAASQTAEQMLDVRARTLHFITMIHQHFDKKVVKQLGFLKGSIKELSNLSQAYHTLYTDEVKARFRARRRWIRQHRADSGFASPGKRCAATVLSCGLDAFSPELNRCRLCCLPLDLPLCCVCTTELFKQKMHGPHVTDYFVRRGQFSVYRHPDTPDPYHSMCWTCEPTLVCVGQHFEPNKHSPRSDLAEIFVCCPAACEAFASGVGYIVDMPCWLPCFLPIFACRGWAWYAEKVHACMRDEHGAEAEARHALDWGGATTCCKECCFFCKERPNRGEDYPVRAWRERTYALTDRGEDGAPLPSSGPFEYYEVLRCE